MNSLDANILDDVIDAGIHSFGTVVDTDASHEFLRQIKNHRTFNDNLFLSESEFHADPQYRGVNPRPGRNLLDKLQHSLDFVENNAQIVHYLSMLLGPRFWILDKKLVAGVPESIIPGWVKNRIRGNLVNNLGAFIRPEYRDITYFWGIDLHQDIIDWKSRPADFVTLYVYLHEVADADAPLFLLPGTHRLGATTFPHDVTSNPSAPMCVVYSDRQGRSVSTTYRKLTGPAGTTNLWHACLLHGTQPNVADHERISLRYLVARDPDAIRCGIDVVNEQIVGPLSINETRQDVDAKGAPKIKGNKINHLVK